MLKECFTVIFTGFCWLLLSEKSCKTFCCFVFVFVFVFVFFNMLLFLFINLFFMIVKFCTYQFIEPHKFLNVGSRE